MPKGSGLMWLEQSLGGEIENQPRRKNGERDFEGKDLLGRGNSKHTGRKRIYPNIGAGRFSILEGTRG